MAKKISPFENLPILGTLKKGEVEYEIPTELADHKDILEETEEHPSFRFLYLFGIVFCLVLLFRLVNLQVTNGFANRSLAEGNRVRLLSVEPSRGIISDSQGQILVNNVPSYSLEIYPSDLPRLKADRQKLYQTLQHITNLPMDTLQSAEKTGLTSLDPVVIKDNIDRNTALIWESQITDLYGVAIGKQPRREYTNTPTMSQILGYVGKVAKQDLPKSGYTATSSIGKTGLELSYEDQLHGQPGQQQIEVDSHGRLQRVLSQTAPQTGNNLVLNIDSRLQTVAATALNDALKKYKSQNSVAIAMDPRDGSIRAMVSLPAYDNNLFARGITTKEYQSLISDPNHPMLNRAIAGTYPSGSTIKPIVASAALQDKVITANTLVDTSAGAIKIGQWVFPDWTVHGITDVTKAIAQSNDVFFYTMGGGWNSIKGLGIDRLAFYYRQFGFGSQTGVDLPGEASGLVPDDAWKQKNTGESWYLGDTYHMAIGQGYFLTTPLQLVNATAAIANGGQLLEPHVVSKIVDNNGNILSTTQKKVIRSNFISAQNLQTVRDGMRLAVTGGSAQSLKDLPVPAAAKTGTAEFGDTKETHAWFTAYAPYDKPQLVVVVLVEGGGEGYSVAGPVAKTILQTYFSLNPH